MKKFSLVLSCILLSFIGYGQIVSFNGQFFKIDTLYPLYDIPSHNKGLSFPWEITYGPDDSLWIPRPTVTASGKFIREIRVIVYCWTSAASLLLTTTTCRTDIRRHKAD